MQNLKPMEEYKKSKNAPEAEAPEVDETPEMGHDEDGTDHEEETEAPEVPDFGTEEPVAALPPSTDAGTKKPSMSVVNLKKLADQSNQLVSMIQSGEIEPWAADHITTSATDIEEVYNYYKYGSGN